MPQLRLALAQINPTVGDFEGNRALILEACKQAASGGAHVIAFPEMALTGYPVEDLVNRYAFQQASELALTQLQDALSTENLSDVVVIVGHLSASGFRPLNSLSVLYQSQPVVKYDKHQLPNYGVFDEHRNFTAGDHPVIIRVGGIDIALAICEDIWQDNAPLDTYADSNVGLLLVVNGSPFEMAKTNMRYELARKQAARLDAAVAYVNLVGGQDELVFDGGSFVVNNQGEIIARAPQFQSGIMMVDLDLKAAEVTHDVAEHLSIISSWPAQPYRPAPLLVAETQTELESIYQALVLSLKDYVTKNGFSNVLLGVSGGIDSALVAAIASDALGPTHVYGVSMPSKFSSDHSKQDALELMNNLGAHYQLIDIQPMVDEFEKSLQIDGIAYENIQARVRGMVLMSLSNKAGHLVLATGNKSELAVGYSTIYGDAVGGFAPIKDIPKTMVWQLARLRNDIARTRGQIPPIPESSLTKPPSAELRSGQKDSDSLPDYALLDAILKRYVEEDIDADTLITDFDKAVVHRILDLVDRAEYKRRQYPPGTKISARAFGRDRRLPITSRWRAN
jgi:NAD+ synthase (glutamine-hydrolysing)